MVTINLYTSPTCPKCKILKKLCDESKFIKDSDFQLCDVTEPGSEAYIETLREQGISELPILLVDDKFLHFDEAVNFLKERG